MIKSVSRFLALLTVNALFAAQAMAIGINDPSFKDQTFRPNNLPGGPATVTSPENVINSIFQFGTNFLLYAAGSVAVLLLVVGGVMYTVSFGEQERMDSAKKIIKYALIGLLVIILAYAIVSNVISIVYNTTSG